MDPLESPYAHQMEKAPDLPLAAYHKAWRDAGMRHVMNNPDSAEAHAVVLVKDIGKPPELGALMRSALTPKNSKESRINGLLVDRGTGWSKENGRHAFSWLSERYFDHYRAALDEGELAIVGETMSKRCHSKIEEIRIDVHKEVMALRNGCPYVACSGDDYETHHKVTALNFEKALTLAAEIAESSSLPIACFVALESAPWPGYVAQKEAAEEAGFCTRTVWIGSEETRHIIVRRPATQQPPPPQLAFPSALKALKSRQLSRRMALHLLKHHGGAHAFKENEESAATARERYGDDAVDEEMERLKTRDRSNPSHTDVYSLASRNEYRAGLGERERAIHAAVRPLRRTA